MAANVFDELSAFLSKIEPRSKTAGAKSAFDAPTSHPSGSGDNQTQASSEGAQSRANESAVKDQVGCASTDSQQSNTPPTQASLQLNIGTEKLQAQDKPEFTPKSSIDDPGTSHPATTEDGQKYGSFNRNYKVAEKIGNELLTILHKAAAAPATTVREVMSTTAPVYTQKAAQNQADARAAAEAYEQQELIAKIEKSAEVLHQVHCEATRMADLTVHYLTARAQTITKIAEHEQAQSYAAYEAEEDEKDKKHRSSSAANVRQSTPVVRLATALTRTKKSVDSAAEEGDTQGAEGMPLPPDVAGVTGGGGGDPSMAGGPPMGGEGEAIEMLLQALAERGLTPEDLLQMLQQMPPAGGGEGGPPMDPAALAAMGGGGAPIDPAAMMGGGGGPPPMDPAAMGGMQVQASYVEKVAAARLVKVANAAVAAKKRGFRYKAPMDEKQARKRLEINRTLDDLFGR